MRRVERSNRVPLPRAVLVAVPALVLLVAVGMRDVTAALSLAGLGAVLCGLIVLMSRAPGRTRRGAVAALAVGGAGLFLGGTALASPALPAVPLPTAVLEQRVQAAPTTPLAAAALADLRVKGAAPMTGYQRTDDFGPAWQDVDRNGCDTRNDVLRRDLVQRTETRCKVLSGVLHDPYTGRTIRFVRGQGTSEAVQIDHVVPLADAWRTGAQRLTQRQRVALANDPVNLYAVDGSANTRKSDGDAATWLPKQKAFRCTYVAHQIAVKRTYGLWVLEAERAAMARVLRACPTQRLPAATPSTATTPSSGHPSSAATPPAGTAVVTPGAFCTPAGATGRTASGTAVVCRTTSTDERNRWRSAA